MSADDDLRPSMTKLASVTRDLSTEDSIRLLAMDIAEREDITIAEAVQMLTDALHEPIATTREVGR